MSGVYLYPHHHRPDRMTFLLIGLTAGLLFSSVALLVQHAKPAPRPTVEIGLICYETPNPAPPDGLRPASMGTPSPRLFCQGGLR